MTMTKPSRNADEGLSRAHCIEIVQLLREWRAATEPAVRAGMAGPEEVKKLRMAAASTDGLLSRLRGEIEKIEKGHDARQEALSPDAEKRVARRH
jgi:hypothetical protein